MDLKPEMIEFDSIEHFPGDALSGTFKLPITKPTFVESVKFQVKGVSRTCWGGVEKVGEWYHIDKEICSDTVCKTQLSPGTHPIPFSFDLPTTLPPTFNFPNASIHYQIKAIVKESNEQWDFARKEFTVSHHYSHEEWKSMERRTPRYFTMDNLKVLKPIGRHRGEINFFAQLNRKIFSPGGGIEINTKVTNNSTKVINCFTVKLVKNVVGYSSKSPSLKRSFESVIEKKVTLASIHPKKVNIRTLTSTVPHDATPTFTSEIIRINYELRIKIEFFGTFIQPVRITIPIVVGIKAFSLEDFGLLSLSAPNIFETFTVGARFVEVEIGDPPSYNDFIVADGLPSYSEVVMA